MHFATNLGALCSIFRTKNIQPVVGDSIRQIYTTGLPLGEKVVSLLNSLLFLKTSHRMRNATFQTTEGVDQHPAVDCTWKSVRFRIPYLFFFSGMRVQRNDTGLGVFTIKASSIVEIERRNNCYGIFGKGC